MLGPCILVVVESEVWAAMFLTVDSGLCRLKDLCVMGGLTADCPSPSEEPLISGSKVVCVASAGGRGSCRCPKEEMSEEVSGPAVLGGSVETGDRSSALLVRFVGAIY